MKRDKFLWSTCVFAFCFGLDVREQNTIVALRTGELTSRIVLARN